MDVCHLLSLIIIFGVVLIALHIYFSFYYKNACMWHSFVHRYTTPTGFKWSTCSYGRSDPTKFLLHFWDLQENFSVSSKQAATGKKAAVLNTAALYFKWICWSQNLRTWKACAYYVVGLQDLKSSSKGTYSTIKRIPEKCRIPTNINKTGLIIVWYLARLKSVSKTATCQLLNSPVFNYVTGKKKKKNQQHTYKCLDLKSPYCPS